MFTNYPKLLTLPHPNSHTIQYSSLPPFPHLPLCHPRRRRRPYGQGRLHRWCRRLHRLWLGYSQEARGCRRDDHRRNVASCAEDIPDGFEEVSFCLLSLLVTNNTNESLTHTHTHTLSLSLSPSLGAGATSTRTPSSRTAPAWRLPRCTLLTPSLTR